MTGDRAVSESLGFVLVFALVVTTTTAVFVLGMGGFEDRQRAERTANVERAFDVLADNLGDVRRYEDPSRATEIRLSGGTLALGDEVTVRVGVYDGGYVDEREFTLRPIVYRADGTEIAYEGGAVVRTDRGSGIVVSGPAFVDGDVVLPFVATYADEGSTSVGGRDTVLVAAERGARASPETFEPDAGEEVRVEIESPRADAWADYFEDDDGFADVESSGDEVAATVETTGDDRVTLTRSYVAVEFR
ncbi:DUF7289 family protein [Halegenticoccus tardaugens]|uniref:DUF7289 family protein n=1 Tax=Halegenticoccus tardaugens TaxID=2071624 RepID=UPI00100B01EF|nr:hypothetical protein [Halegenticoccus tardaugens]